jgi:hypothetical protein
MAVLERQLLGELVDYADVAVRCAGQLHLLRLGRKLRDREALARAIEFLETAEAGGMFMSSGESGNMWATLRPMNWAADAKYSSGSAVSYTASQKVDYGALASFLQEVRSTLEQVLGGGQPTASSFDECIEFFDSLGETLGNRADRSMRRASVPCGRFANY